MRSEHLKNLEIGDFAIGRLLEAPILGQLTTEGILNHVEQAPDGTLLRSVAVALVNAPLSQVTSEVQRIRTHRGGFLRDVNIINKVQFLGEDGDRLRIRLELRYRFFLFRTKFTVDADVTVDDNGSLDLVGTSGKPQGLQAHFRAQPVTVTEGGPEQTLVYCSLRFDVHSLGWLVDYFLRHHPEIELGVFSATAPVIVLTLKQAVESQSRTA